eukprot:TRINITY_DN20710_c0_g1_i1.p1 TRINITY_DN20710_c0_g1~~TRINITY_DN20710_c0_g1_i1.p1  ORF type:complete len:506 (+),score=97.98 TRINITY_DN20710_c0_g1_i1:47-1564(+)
MRAKYLPKGGLLLCFDTFQIAVDICSTDEVSDITWSEVDGILVSHPLGMCGVVEVTEYCGGSDVPIYCSEPVLDAACVLLESTRDEYNYETCEIRTSLDKVTTTNKGETITINDTTSVTPLSSTECVGGFGWLIRNFDDFILVQNSGPVNLDDLNKFRKGRQLTAIITSSFIQQNLISPDVLIQQIKHHTTRNETIILTPSLRSGPVQSLIWCHFLMENRAAVSIHYDGGKLLEYASRLYTWLPPELQLHVNVPDCPLKGYSGAPFVVTTTSQIRGHSSGRCCYIPATGSEKVITELVNTIKGRIQNKTINTSGVVILKNIECGQLSLSTLSQQVRMLRPKVALCGNDSNQLQELNQSQKEYQIKPLSSEWEVIPRISNSFRLIGNIHRSVAKRTRNEHSVSVPGQLTWPLGNGTVRRRGSSFTVAGLSPFLDTTFFGTLSKESFNTTTTSTNITTDKNSWKVSLPDIKTEITSNSPTETSVQFEGSPSQLQDVQQILEKSLLRV